MKRVLVSLCLILVCLTAAMISPPVIAQTNTAESEDPVYVLLNPTEKPATTEIKLPLTAIRGYPPKCSLIFQEVTPDCVNFTIQIVGMALFWQDENIGTWITLDNQEPAKLDRSLLAISTNALAGAVFKSEYHVSLPNLSEGCHTIKIEIYELPTYWDGNITDYYGADKLDRSEGTLNLGIDSTAPIINETSIENSIYFKKDLELYCTINEPFEWVAYSLDNQANITIKSSQQGDFNFSNTSNQNIPVNTTLTNLTEGIHSLTVYAKDTVGNVGASQTITFTVVKMEFVVLVVAVCAAIVAAAAAGLILLRRHHRNPLGSS